MAGIPVIVLSHWTHVYRRITRHVVRHVSEFFCTITSTVHTCRCRWCYCWCRGCVSFRSCCLNCNTKFWLIKCRIATEKKQYICSITKWLAGYVDLYNGCNLIPIVLAWHCRRTLAGYVTLCNTVADNCLTASSHSVTSAAEQAADQSTWNIPRLLNKNTHTQPFYGSVEFVRENPGEPVPEETFTHYSHCSHQSSLSAFSI